MCVCRRVYVSSCWNDRFQSLKEPKCALSVLHVAVGVSGAALQPLPHVDHLGLIFDHVGEDTVEWASGVARKLQPGKGYHLFS